jgi:hypothetical protein
MSYLRLRHVNPTQFILDELYPLELVHSAFMITNRAGRLIHSQAGPLRGPPLLFFAASVAVFFLTLRLFDPTRPGTPLNSGAATDRLATQTIPSLAELPTVASEAGLKFARSMHGHTDVLSRINKREVMMGGWIADLDGDATPNELFVFVGGALRARTKTAGERPDVQQALNLYFGTEKNVGFQVAFACGPGEQPVAVALGKDDRYFGLNTPHCP